MKRIPAGFVIAAVLLYGKGYSYHRVARLLGQGVSHEGVRRALHPRGRNEQALRDAVVFLFTEANVLRVGEISRRLRVSVQFVNDTLDRPRENPL